MSEATKIARSAAPSHGSPDGMLGRVDGVADRFSITFDDGPSPTWTPILLDVLARAGARATFFPLAPNVRRRPDLVRRAHEEGHEIGVHGEWHLPPALVPWRLVAREIARGRDAVTAATGVAPRRYRPPFGLMRAAQCARVLALGLTPVLGDVYPRDVERPGVDAIVARTFARLRPGSVLILHDSSGLGDFDRAQSVAAARVILAEAAARGWRSVSVGELLALAPARPDAPGDGARAGGREGPPA